MKGFIPHGFNAWHEEIQNQHKQAIRDRGKQEKANQYEKIGHQSEVQVKDDKTA